MPHFEIKKGPAAFPPAHFADIDGLVAVGGDMTADNLIKAYNSALYYWHHPMKHVKWWSPDPRLVLELPAHLAQPADADTNGRNVMRTEQVEALLRHLQSVFNQQEEMNPRWLPERMFRIFTELHGRKLLRCYEIREHNTLIGGLFGVAIGKIFFGEYIWAPDNAAVDLALHTLVTDLEADGFLLIDMQKPTFRSETFPCDEISRLSYTDQCKVNAAQSGY